MDFTGSLLWLAACCLLAVVSGCDQSTDLGASNDAGASPQDSDSVPDGSASRPLRVMLIPADGGTEEGTRADFEPVFAAITRHYQLHFEIRVGQAYNAVVEGMSTGKVDIAFFGPVTFHQAKSRGAAELLAVGVSGGESVYYSGIFVNQSSGLQEITDLAGHSIAFGDVNSTSSFNFPVAMLIDAGVDPVQDVSEIYLTGSHANALSALAAGKVDAACASYSSFEKAVANGQIDPRETVPLAKSDPIPYPPLAIHPAVEDSIRQKLRDAFNHVHEVEGVSPDMIRGYGGKKVDRYNADYSEAEFDRAMAKLEKVTDELKAEMLRKAAEK